MGREEAPISESQMKRAIRIAMYPYGINWYRLPDQRELIYLNQTFIRVFPPYIQRVESAGSIVTIIHNGDRYRFDLETRSFIEV